MPQSRVYVSHSPSDNDWCRAFAQSLQGAGLSVWFDERGPEAGPAWVASSEQAVQACDMVILVVSPDALNSAWVQHEIQLALGANRTVGPILIANASLPGVLQSLQPINGIGQNPAQVAQVVAGRMGAVAAPISAGRPVEAGPTNAPEYPPREAYPSGPPSAPRSTGNFPPREDYARGPASLPRPGAEFPGRDNGGALGPARPVGDFSRNAPPSFPARPAYNNGGDFNEAPKKQNTPVIAGSVIAIVALVALAWFVGKPLLHELRHGSTSSTSSAPTTVPVQMNASQYLGPTTVTITQGGTIVFDDLANGGATHILVVGLNGGYVANQNAPGQLNVPAGMTITAGQKISVVFTQTGTYQITCVIHPAMNLTVVVS